MTFKLLVKPCQSGKTFELITKTVQLLERNKQSIHLIIVDNSLIQLEQLDTRIKDVVKLPVLVINSDNRLNADEIKTELKQKKIKYILLCANITQLAKIDNVMRTNRKNDFYIWIDEMDKITEPMNIKIIDNWKSYQSVADICFISASPTPLIRRYGNLDIVEVQSIYSRKSYSKWTNHKINIVPQMSVKKFHTHVFEMEKPQKNQRWFIAPGASCSLHWKVAKWLAENYRFYCLVINNDGEILRKPSGEKIPMEYYGLALADRIRKLYEDNNLANHRFAIIGFNRLSRGITIQGKGMLFSHAVFASTPSTEQGIYQLGGRCMGNFKELPGYKKIKIFCTEKFNEVACAYESIAVTLPKFSKITEDKYDIIEEKAFQKCS